MLKKIKGKINLSLEIIKNVKNWLTVFFIYLGLFKKEYILFKFRDGKKVKVLNPRKEGETSGIATIWEIFIRKNYNPRGMEIKDTDVIIDIGANIGIFSLYASLKARNGKIYSYEPFENHFKRMQENIKINKAKNIFPFNLAISNKKGKKYLFINENSSGMHSTVFNKNSKDKVKINTATLEDVFKENKLKKCDFLKMDCEGAEYDIIFNTKKETFNKIKKISLEFDNIDKEKNCFKIKEILEKNGFQVKIKGAHSHQGILYARKL
jgi:FkbM family methyltransferase